LRALQRPDFTRIKLQREDHYELTYHYFHSDTHGRAVLPAGDAVAQQRVSYKVSAETAKYQQVYYLDVGDVPGHQVGVSELHRV
jgi:hypothetical protein